MAPVWPTCCQGSPSTKAPSWVVLMGRLGWGLEAQLNLPACKRRATSHRPTPSCTKDLQPQVIRSDNGPEYISGTFIAWADRRGIRLDHIQPGKARRAESPLRLFPGQYSFARG